MSFVIEDVLVRHDPAAQRLPVLFDSPHSGIVYPADFAFVCPLPVLRQAEDTFVGELFAAAPECGATLLEALFPRSYIDPNRAIDDIEPEMLDGPWPEPLRPTEHGAAGMGLIRTLCRPGLPVYDGKLSVLEVAERIDRYYRPYHFQLASILDGLHARFGRVWFIDCHSMPATGLDGVEADFVIGDRDGATADSAFVDFVAGLLSGFGYRVAINAPYKGLELIRRYGDPAQGRQAIQLEINRRLYMNEETQLRHEGFEVLRRHMAMLIRRVTDHVERQLARRAAE